MSPQLNNRREHEAITANKGDKEREARVTAPHPSRDIHAWIMTSASSYLARATSRTRVTLDVSRRRYCYAEGDLVGKILSGGCAPRLLFPLSVASRFKRGFFFNWKCVFLANSRSNNDRYSNKVTFACVHEVRHL